MYKITQINNTTHKLTVLDENGKRVNVTIPDEHVSSKQENSYLSGHMDAHHKHFKSAKHMIISLYIVGSLAALEAIAIAVMLHRHGF